MKYQDVISKLESNNSRIFKEDLLSNYINDPIFQEAMCLALDQLITFGVSEKSIPHATDVTAGYDEMPWEDFKELADKLASRELTGNDAIHAIEIAISRASVGQ